VFEDAVLFALLVLPIVRQSIRRAAPSGDPPPGLLATLIEETVDTLGLRMALPNAVAHRIKQALAIVGRLSHRPDARVATRRLALREAFPAALELFELRAMATGRGSDLVEAWRDVLQKGAKVRAGLPQRPAPVPRGRRRRRGGRRPT
jgi:hypothetical protein